MKTLTYYIDRQEAFRKFKEDIEQRLAKWLVEHPEGEGILQRAKPKKRTVSVMPSVFDDGGWVVYSDGVIIQKFLGHDAWAKATKLCNDILNNPGSDITRP